MLRTTLLATAIAAAAVVAAPAARATESFDACTGVITSLPTTITKAGVWCLQKDLSTAMTSGMAITVAANNVTVNCNGFRLGGLAGGPMAMTYAVWSDRPNTRVQNCHTRGFAWAIAINNASAVIEDSIIEGATVNALYLDGVGHEVRRNRFIDIGGTEFQPTVIAMRGSASIHDNLVAGVWSPAASAFGVVATESSTLMLHDNTLIGFNAEGLHHVFPVYLSSSHGVIERNRFQSHHGGTAIGCELSSASVRGNALVGFDATMSGCTDGGDNQSVGLEPPAP